MYNYFFLVKHLSSYLTMRFNLDQDEDFGNNQMKVLFYILYNADQLVLLNDNMTFQNVQKTFWNVKKEKPIEIFYSYN